MYILFTVRYVEHNKLECYAHPIWYIGAKVDIKFRMIKVTLQ